MEKGNLNEFTTQLFDCYKILSPLKLSFYGWIGPTTQFFGFWDWSQNLIFLMLGLVLDLDQDLSF